MNYNQSINKISVSPESVQEAIKKIETLFPLHIESEVSVNDNIERVYFFITPPANA